MKLIALEALWGPARLPHNVGDVFEVEDEIGEILLAKRVCEVYKEEAPAPKELPAEAATKTTKK
jgi:hypothetical protein